MDAVADVPALSHYLCFNLQTQERIDLGQFASQAEAQAAQGPGVFTFPMNATVLCGAMQRGERIVFPDLKGGQLMLTANEEKGWHLIPYESSAPPATKSP